MSAVPNSTPTSVQELCDVLRDCGERGDAVELGGAFSKQTMGGPVAAADARISTVGLNRLLAYEPADLTISVEAGMLWRDLSRVLEENHQFLPIDPPFGDTATVGGVVASDSSGPRRRRFGSARDMTIGMRFATVEGKLVSSGGMVVKNVTGLDMAKLLIGSFGTLAAIGTVNFKVLPKPEATGSFVFSSEDLSAVMRTRRQILSSTLQPVSLDLLSGSDVTAAASDKRYRLVAEVHGNKATVARHDRDYSEFARANGVEFSALGAADERLLWADVREFTSRWMTAHPEGGVVRVSTAPSDSEAMLSSVEGPNVTRATVGVTYIGCSDAEELGRQLGSLRSKGFKSLVEHAGPSTKAALEQWAEPSESLALMLRIKSELDPNGLLNAGRLFGKI